MLHGAILERYRSQSVSSSQQKNLIGGAVGGSAYGFYEVGVVCLSLFCRCCISNDSLLLSFIKFCWNSEGGCVFKKNQSSLITDPLNHSKLTIQHNSSKKLT